LSSKLNFNRVDDNVFKIVLEPYKRSSVKQSPVFDTENYRH